MFTLSSELEQGNAEMIGKRLNVEIDREHNEYFGWGSYLQKIKIIKVRL